MAGPGLPADVGAGGLPVRALDVAAGHQEIFRVWRVSHGTRIDGLMD